MPKSWLPDEETIALDRLAHITIVYLVVVSFTSFFAGAFTLTVRDVSYLLPITFIGISGSATAALTSSLDRYANGFERGDGKPYPETVKEGISKFNRRFARWLFVRPFLGAIVAPVFLWGLGRFTKNPEQFLGETQMVGFTAFLAGFLAKSVLDLIKSLFKNVFRA